jgi:DNA-binding NarL/FixJ family response regulator
MEPLLPTRSARERIAPAGAVAPNPAGATATPTPRNPVFIVDDSPVVRDRLLAMISELPNVEVVGQADVAFEAIHSIRRLRPAVVVLDISMPGGSGMYVLETVKKDRPGPMVIMLTNFAHEPYRQKCLQLGADYFFDKSTEFERVTQVLRDLPAPGEPSAARHP